MLSIGGNQNQYAWVIGIIVVIAIVVIIYMLYPDTFSKADKGKKGESYRNPSTIAGLPPAYAGSLRGRM